MAVKRRLIECECGEVFVDGRNNQLEGNLNHGIWQLKQARQRSTKSKTGSDILFAAFERAVSCGKCGSELLREKRQYELTPPQNPNKPEPIASMGSRELIVRQGVAQEPPQSDVNLTADHMIPEENIVKISAG